MPRPRGGLVSPPLRLDGHNLVGARVDNSDVFEIAVLADRAGVIGQQADATQRVAQQLPSPDRRLAGTEHFKLDPKRAVIGIGGDVAPRRRLRHHPSVNRLAQRLAHRDRQFLSKTNERLAALLLERILRQRLLVIVDRVIHALLRFVDIAANAQRQRIAETARQRCIHVVQRNVGLSLFEPRLAPHGVGLPILGIDLNGAGVVANGVVVAAIVGEQDAALHIGLDQIRIELEHFVEISQCPFEVVQPRIGLGAQQDELGERRLRLQGHGLRGVGGGVPVITDGEVGLGAVAVGLGISRVEADGAGQVAYGGVVARKFGLRAAAPVKRDRTLRHELRGLAERLERRAIFMECRIGVAAIVVSRAVGRTQGDRPVEVLERFLGMAEIHQSVAAIVVDRGVLGRELDSLVEIGDRSLGLLHAPFGDAPIAVNAGLDELGDVGRRQGFVVEGHGLVELPPDHRRGAFAGAQQDLILRVRRRHRHDGENHGQDCREAQADFRANKGHAAVKKAFRQTLRPFMSPISLECVNKGSPGPGQASARRASSFCKT